jgi:hypothetical protein
MEEKRRAEEKSGERRDASREPEKRSEEAMAQCTFAAGAKVRRSVGAEK